VRFTLAQEQDHYISVKIPKGLVEEILVKKEGIINQLQKEVGKNRDIK